MTIVAVVGYHNSGKTTLIERIAKALTERGYKVGYIKHDPKGHAVTDKEGSDTFRLKKILNRVALSSPEGVVLWSKERDDPIYLAKIFFEGFDVVLVEGYKNHPYLKKVGIGERFEAKEVILWVEGPEEWEKVLSEIERLLEERGS